MGFLRGFSKFLFAFPVIVLVYDLVEGWFVKNRFKIRSFKEWWVWLDKKSYDDTVPALRGMMSFWDELADWSAPLVLLIPPVTLYLLYRIIFALRGGQGGRGGFVYRSRD